MENQTVTIRHNKAVKYYQLVRFMANLFSKDDSTKVGCLFIKPDTYEILTLGYNGMPRGVNEKAEHRWKRPEKYDYFEHAERNAIFNAARTGTSLLGSICIVTLFPCCDCARGIIQSGAKMVVSMNPFIVNDRATIDRWGSKWKTSMEMLKEAGVQIHYLSVSDVQIDARDAMNLMNGLINSTDIENEIEIDTGVENSDCGECSERVEESAYYLGCSGCTDCADCTVCDNQGTEPDIPESIPEIDGEDETKQSETVCDACDSCDSREE
jgi:dCMP deaminase